MTGSDGDVENVDEQPSPGGEPDADDIRDTADPVIARIHQSVRAVADIHALPLEQHPDLYAAVHTQLQGELADIDGGMSSG